MSAPKEEPIFPKKKLVRSASRSVSYTDLNQIDASQDVDPNKLINLGVCAMEKKVVSDAMKQILKRINEPKAYFNIIIFQEELIFYKKVNEWPIVEALITFYSDGFPFQKVKEYCEMRKPFLINDINKQQILWNRCLVYKELKKAGIPIPNHVFVKRDFTQNLLVKNFPPPVNEKMSSTNSNPLNNNNNNYDKLDKISFDVQRNSGVEMKSRANSIDEEVKKLSILEKLNNSPEFPPGVTGMNTTPLNQSEKTSFLLEEIPNQLVEHDDYVIIHGYKMSKPIVEKPYDAEDHNINIYYPKNVGGGCKKLFRKVGNCSSVFDPCCNNIRTEGNYIYEEFLPTDGFDIKVYTVGPDYAHAEARKSPALDGKVERGYLGKEFRYPVNLTSQEKILARKVVLWFGQNICGFDLLRSKGKSYVCDVNGWSFVKGNQNYYRDCSWILRKMILKELAPKKFLELASENNNFLRNFNEEAVYKFYNKMSSNKETNDGNMIASLFRPSNPYEIFFGGEELRSIVAVFRHGDRTPKQKMKMIVTLPEILSFFDGKENIHKEIKLKKAQALQRMLDITRNLLQRVREGQLQYEDSEGEEDDYHENLATKLLQLQSILEKGGHFDEINRKIQLRPLKYAKFQEEGQEKERVIRALLILKWGGELTHSGEEQAQAFGTKFRTVYNNTSEGLLRLHNSYRHDLKIYASDEGRCIKTAAAFCKGFLNLEGELTPIAVSMVRKDELSQELLDFRAHDLEFLDEMKKELAGMLNKHGNILQSYRLKHSGKVFSDVLESILRKIECPLDLMKKLHKSICQLTKYIGEDVKIKEKSYYIAPNDMSIAGCSDSLQTPCKFIGCGQENIILIFKRWRKLEIDFFDKKKEIFNISKIPDINDMIKYDAIHNLEYFSTARLSEISTNIFLLSELLASFVVPYEYGSSPLKKTEIGIKIISPLFRKIKSDLLWWTTALAEKNELFNTYQEESSYYMLKNKDIIEYWRHIRTRLYFTSASHLYSLFNVLNYNAGENSLPRNTRIGEQINILHYLSHIVFKLYENLDADDKDPKRFRLEISMSPGCVMEKIEKFHDHLVPITEPIIFNEKLTLEELEKLFKELNIQENDNGKNSN